MKEEAKADAPAWINDAHWGQGGRYVFDPATGCRTRLDEAAEAVAPAADANAGTDEQPPMKGKKHG